jgi:hypothetical protein
MFGLSIDDVEIAAGTQNPLPDLYAASLQFKAYQSCELADSAVIMVYNMGDVGSKASIIDIKYKLNDGQWQTQDIVFPAMEGGDGLGTGEGIPVYIAGLDFSATGEYTLTVVAETPNQGTVYNDTITGKITKTEPTLTLPYRSDFGNAADVADWTMLTPRDWTASNGYMSAQWLDVPLISKCIELEAGEYDLKTTFTAGFILFPLLTDFTVAMGQPGVYPSEWTDIIVNNSALDTQGRDTTVTYTFTVAESGTYQFAYTLLSGMMSVKNFEISKVSTGIEQISGNKTLLVMAPNPATTQAIIRAQNDEIQQIVVSDLTGKTIFTSPGNLKTSTYEINVTKMPKGVYLVKIFTEKTPAPQTEKLIVK